MIHPDTELRWISDAVGHGVVATRPIPRGTLVWTLCAFDIVLTPARLRALPEAYQRIAATYGYVDRHGDTVLCWDLGRYVNHACNPSMLSVGHANEVCVRDLAPGDELTCDYGTLNYAQDLACRCGDPQCRGTVTARDALSYGDTWHHRVASALGQAAQVAQPLLPYVRDRAEWDDYLAGRRTVPAPSSFHFAADETR